MSVSDHLVVPERLSLPRPEFNIDADDENLEVWTMRVPVNVPINSLNGVNISMQGGEFQVGDQDYKIIPGDTVESDSFRVLIPLDDAGKDSSSEDSDDQEKDKRQQYLQPFSRPFSRHWNVVAAIPELSETKLAPREGPKPQDKMRHAYTPVAQRTGLKRRWMPLGVKVDPAALAQTLKSEPKLKERRVKLENAKKGKAIDATPPEKRTKVEISETPKSTPSQSDKKSTKAEKKAAKKAKKDAKKAKKEKRKSK